MGTHKMQLRNKVVYVEVPAHHGPVMRLVCTYRFPCVCTGCSSCKGERNVGISTKSTKNLTAYK